MHNLFFFSEENAPDKTLELFLGHFENLRSDKYNWLRETTFFFRKLLCGWKLQASQTCQKFYSSDTNTQKYIQQKNFAIQN